MDINDLALVSTRAGPDGRVTVIYRDRKHPWVYYHLDTFDRDRIPEALTTMMQERSRRYGGSAPSLKPYPYARCPGD